MGHIWQRYLDTGSVQQRSGRGRKRITTAPGDRYIVNLARRRRFDSAKILCAEVQNAIEFQVDELDMRRPAVRPPLDAQHMRLRLGFALRQ